MIKKLNYLFKKYHSIIIFVIFVITLMYISYTNEEQYIDFIPFDMKKIKKLIMNEQEVCSNKNLCGFIDGKVIPCPPKSCNDTCICNN